MNRLILLIAIITMSLEATAQDLPDGLYADMKTNKGDIMLRLFYDKVPYTVGNFVALAEGDMKSPIDKQYEGKKYFDNTKFHRVVPNFVIQGGDPTGRGNGGPGYSFLDEIDPTLKHDKAGILSMANSGPDSNGSQFFITHTPTPHLDGKHAVFGEVVDQKSMDVVNSIAQGDTLEAVTIIRKGRDAKKYDAYKSFSEGKENVLAKREQFKKDAEARSAAQLNEAFEKYAGMSKADFDSKAVDASSGVKQVILKEGTGANPKAGDNISAHYTLFLGNGNKIDSSIERNEPLKFKVGVGQVIPGWDKHLLEMKVGEKDIIAIPSELGYGPQGAGAMIPPNSTLYFVVELVGIE